MCLDLIQCCNTTAQLLQIFELHFLTLFTAFSKHPKDYQWKAHKRLHLIPLYSAMHVWPIAQQYKQRTAWKIISAIIAEDYSWNANHVSWYITLHFQPCQTHYATLQAKNDLCLVFKSHTEAITYIPTANRHLHSSEKKKQTKVAPLCKHCGHCG